MENAIDHHFNSSHINPEFAIRDWDIWDYLLLACLIFGTIGNSLSIFIMNSKELRNTNNSLFVSKTNISIIIIVKLFILLYKVDLHGCF
jgi:hypothetical protein